MVKISVIIPIYGVEAYIERCAESLMQQTLADVEFIFVDDCTKDKSIDKLIQILNKYPERKSKILHHERNMGLPAARNTGLESASGDYVFHCDSDDYLETDALEKLYSKAFLNDAEIVWSDFFEDYSKGQRYISQPSFETAEEAIVAMMTSGMRFNVWNKLCKRSLYTDYGIKFLEGNSMGEDMCMMKVFLHASKIAHVPEALYHYVRSNPGALTKDKAQKRIQEDKNNITSLKAFFESETGTRYADYIGYHTLWTKLPLLLTDGRNGQYKEWLRWSTESHPLIKKLPNANRRIKWLMLMAERKQWWFLRMHYWLIIKLYYNIRYRHKA